MSSLIKELTEKELIHPPRWLADNTMYLTMMGSVAYGCSSDTSDMDLYGFAIPTKGILFPHTLGLINGFGDSEDFEEFKQFDTHHVKDPSAGGGKGKEYDFNVYNIVKYFQLCYGNNPNMIDSLYTPQFCVLHTTTIGDMVRDNRDKFLSKKCWPNFRGYAMQQITKAEKVKKKPSVINIRKFEDDHGISHETTYEQCKNRELFPQLNDMEHKVYVGMYEKGLYGEDKDGSKRFPSWKRFNTDVKFLYHLARLMDECEQILTLGTMDLQRGREYMKAIRRGDVSEAELREWFNAKDKQLEKFYAESPLPFKPDKVVLQKLLEECLEHHYGSLSNCLVRNAEAETISALRDIRKILDHFEDRTKIDL